MLQLEANEDNIFVYVSLETLHGSGMKLNLKYTKNPTQMPFGFHKQNVVYSNNGEGFKLYPNGYFPEDHAVFEDVISFRYHGDGIFLHNSKNFGVDGGIIADNRLAIEVDKQVDSVTVSRV